MRPTVYRDFKGLKDLVRNEDPDPAPHAEKSFQEAEPVAGVLTDDDLFAHSMQDVTPLGWSAVPLPPSRPVEIQNPQGSEDEGLRLLTEFVIGKGSVDLTLSGEYIEGASHPEGWLLVDYLRSGRFSVQSHLDLHGMSVEEARERLHQFVRTSLMLGHGCVRIVHGRGHHSADGEPVLKEQVQKWLRSRRMSRHLVAYTSACQTDGGGGAVYVLLRRRSK